MNTYSLTSNVKQIFFFFSRKTTWSQNSCLNKKKKCVKGRALSPLGQVRVAVEV